jgi:hypothetical protein
VITRSRKLRQTDKAIIFSTMIDILKDGPHSVILGGRAGAEVVAFLACAKAKRSTHDLTDFYLDVVLPGHLGDAPAEFLDALKASHLLVDYSVHGRGEARDPRVLVLELGMDPSHPASYQARDAVMLGRAGYSAVEAVAVAFSDGACRSTAQFVTLAREERMRVVEVPLPVEAT